MAPVRPQPSDVNVKAQLIAEILDGIFGEDRPAQKSLMMHYHIKAAKPKQAIGVPYQTPAGNWRELRDFNGKLRSVPSKAPGSGQEAAKPTGTAKPTPAGKKPTTAKPAAASKKPKPAKIDAAAATARIDEMRKSGTSEESLTTFVGELAGMTVPQLKELQGKLGIKPKGNKPDLIAKVKEVIAEFAVPDDVEPVPEEGATPSETPVETPPAATTEPEPPVIPDNESDGVGPLDLDAVDMTPQAEPYTSDGSDAIELDDGESIVLEDEPTPEPDDDPIPEGGHTWKDAAAMQAKIKDYADKAMQELGAKIKPLERAMSVQADAFEHAQEVMDRAKAVANNRSLPDDVRRKAKQEHTQAQAMYTRAVAEYDAATEQRSALMRQGFLKDFAVGNSVHMTPHSTKPPEKYTTGGKPLATPFRTREAFPVKAWMEATTFINALSDKNRTIAEMNATEDTGVGVSYIPETGAVVISKNTPGRSIAHEVAHHIEVTASKKQRARIEAFRVKRFSDPAKDVDLTTFGDNASTRGHKGNFDDMEKLFGKGSAEAAYVGKKYNSGATEIISMGVELMYRNPIHFARTDPEYFSLILSTLQSTGGK